MRRWRVCDVTPNKGQLQRGTGEAPPAIQRSALGATSSMWRVAVGLASVALLAVRVAPCTMIALGKHATRDGSTIVAHTDDAGGDTGDLRLVRIPARNYTLKGDQSQRAVFRYNGGYPRVVAPDRAHAYAPKPGEPLSKPLGFIDQVASTYGYLEQDYGIMNDVQLSIAESTCNSKTYGWSRDLPYGYNLFSIGELTRVALERCDNARCAVQLMGDLAVAHGFYGDYSGTPENPGHGSSEALGITDKYGEVWIFHVLTGPGNASAVWAAQRLEDDHVTIVPNEFVIENINAQDPDRFLASANVFSFAQDMGWWDPAHEPFSFKRAYSYNPELNGPRLFLDGREWRVFDRFAPSLKLTPPLGYVEDKPNLPFSVRVDSPAQVEDVMDILRDHYEGTPYDLTKGFAAGPFGNPVRYSGFIPGLQGGWARAISLHRTLFSFVLQSRGDVPDAVGGIAWYGQSAPHGAVYVPFSGAQQSVPQSYLEGKQSEFSLSSAWWAFDFVNNWCSLRYDIISRDVREEIKRLQSEALQRQALIAKQFQDVGNDDTSVTARLEKENNAFAKLVVADWWQLAWRLVSKYSDGYVSTGEQEGGMQSPGYPVSWVERTEFATWPKASTDKVSTTTPTRISKPLASARHGAVATASSFTSRDRELPVEGVAVGIVVGIVGTVLAVRVQRMLECWSGVPRTSVSESEKRRFRIQPL